MPEPMTAHTATGKSEMADSVALLAYQLVEGIPMSATDVSALTLVHVLAVELSAALARIEELERK